MAILRNRGRQLTLRFEGGRLVTTGSFDVTAERAAAALSGQTSELVHLVEVLEAHCSSQHELEAMLRQPLPRDPDSPIARYTPLHLARMAFSSSPKARLRAAENRSTSPLTLALLAQDADVDLRRALASREDLAPGLLARLLHDPDQVTATKAARNPSLPEAAMRGLELNSDSETLWGLAANEELPPDLMRRLWELHERDTVGIALASNRSLTEDLMEEISVSSSEARSYLAGNRSLPAHLQHRLARDPSWLARHHLADNPALLPEVADVLLVDMDDLIRKSAAENSWVADRRRKDQPPALPEAELARRDAVAAALALERASRGEAVERRVTEAARERLRGLLAQLETPVF